MRNHVLVVDDNAQIGVCFRRALRGCEVQHAATGEQALTMLMAGARYAAIFVDVSLADMSGMELVESVYELAPDQAQRIVFVTGGDTDAVRRQFPQHPVITKPFGVREVRRVVSVDETCTAKGT